MKRYSLSEEVINKVLNYLGNQPYVNVANLISEIQKDAKEMAARDERESCNV